MTSSDAEDFFKVSSMGIASHPSSRSLRSGWDRLLWSHSLSFDKHGLSRETDHIEISCALRRVEE